jgi:hypothetical protein
MTARKAMATAWWLVGGLHPTLRKVREGWGTRFVVWLPEGGKNDSTSPLGMTDRKAQQIPPPFDYAQGTE